jgi:hypothetical protein
MSNNSTKKQKQSYKQLQKHLKATVDIWTKTADELERQAGESQDPNMQEALYLPAAIYRTCCVDLKGVISGEAILDVADSPFKPNAAAISEAN